MLAEVECDVVAIGDYYGRRGQLAIAALRAGRHVISDKPLCTSLDEQMEIERLAHSRNLTVGLQLDSRDRGVLRTLREVVRSGAIGDVCTIRIDGQHPLLFGTRAAWYFEHGRHGGTINDIGIHAFDFVPWITGLNWGYIAAARSWNAKAASAPLFEDCAQVMAVLSNGAGVLADFSYLAPDKLGYELPHYWRVLIHGTKGLADTYLLANGVTVIKDDSTAPEVHPAGPGRARGYLEDFLLELRGEGERAELTSEQCLCASRLALDAQRQAVHC
jgi:predicted dehydrogenase